MDEIWKDINGYEGLYQVSSKGRIRSLDKSYVDSIGRLGTKQGKIIAQRINNYGYHQIHLVKDGKSKTFLVHRLMAEAFIPNPENLPCINHKDENRNNNDLKNLEWCTYQYNNNYGSAPKKRIQKTRGKVYKNGISRPAKVIVQYNLDGEVVNVFSEGSKEVERILGFNSGAINKCCKRKENHITYKGFVWRYKGDSFDVIPQKPKRHQKYVIKIDNFGNEIDRYKSVSEAGVKNGFDRHYFSRKRKSGEIIEINGMRFIIEKKENEFIPKGHKGNRPDLAGKGSIPVIQIDREGNTIAEFDSAKNAAIALGNRNKSSDITNCCRGKLKTAYGYIWKYKRP